MTAHEHNDDLLVKFSEDGKSARLTDALCFDSSVGHIVVPRGFYTDFASIPRVLLRLYPKLDKHIRAAVIHDFLYFEGICSRLDSDKVFLEAMEEHGVSAWKRYSMYWGVRAGGWYVYNKYRKKEKK